jgi:hypothetical protein
MKQGDLMSQKHEDCSKTVPIWNTKHFLQMPVYDLTQNIVFNSLAEYFDALGPGYGRRQKVIKRYDKETKENYYIERMRPNYLRKEMLDELRDELTLAEGRKKKPVNKLTQRICLVIDNLNPSNSGLLLTTRTVAINKFNERNKLNQFIDNLKDVPVYDAKKVVEHKNLQSFFEKQKLTNFHEQIKIYESIRENMEPNGNVALVVESADNKNGFDIVPYDRKNIAHIYQKSVIRSWQRDRSMRVA